MELFWATVGLFLLSSGLQAGLIFLQQSGSRLTRWWGSPAFAVYNIITWHYSDGLVLYMTKRGKSSKNGFGGCQRLRRQGVEAESVSTGNTELVEPIVEASVAG
jgi:hypothetical protein